LTATTVVEFSATAPTKANETFANGRLRSSDQVGRIELRGIDYIPHSERHGRPRELFAVWAASNVTYLYIVIGGALVLLGLDAWQALAVVLAGNAFWALVGLLAISGPVSGTPSEVVTRAIYGIRANRLYNAWLEWGVGVAYEAINLSIGALAAFALIDRLGVHAGTATRVVIVLGTALIAFTISLYGHATIVRLSRWFAAALLCSCAILAFYVLQHTNLDYSAPAGTQVHGTKLWAAISIGFSLVASAPLSWNTGADYSRYLPADASKRAVALWTAAGGLLPAILLSGLGVLAGTAVDMTDPQTSLRAIVPNWFYLLWLLTIFAGSITGNALTAYSSGLSLQAVGIAWKRATTIVFDAGIAIGLACYALFVSNFLSTLNDILALSVAFLGPALAIYGTDIIMRHNRYDGLELHDETPAGPCWYQHGINWPGVGALMIGSGVALLCVNTALLVGPISDTLAGADISAVVGPIIATVVYAAATRHQWRRMRLSGARP
jgi:purine-cytosine permease-like protein